MGPGTRLLDVGTGSGGTVAVPAAQRGADVVGSDFIDTWFDAARRRAAAAGVDVEWVVGDAQELPFEEGSFDVVTSTFGHMFAPDQEAAARELARVVKPGGTIGLACGRPAGNVGRFFATVGSHMPAPPPDFKPPPLWGLEERVIELLEPHGIALEFSHEAVRYDFDDDDELIALMERSFGPLVTAKVVLGDEGWPALREDIVRVFAETNERSDGGDGADMEYLQTIGRRSE